MNVPARVSRRFESHKPAGKPKVLRADHPAAVEGRTYYPARRVKPADAPRLFKPGANNRKIGSHAIKGRFKGMPILTLTLEERATCPRSCANWLDCYGNKMNWSSRHEAGPQLEWRLARELADLQDLHPHGFVIRLHVLGDFYSVGYAKLWLAWIDCFPALHVFGYTAHNPRSEIGQILDAMSRFRWDRFAIRFSNHNLPDRAAATVDLATDSQGAIVCPAQTGASECCGTCGLCWTTRRNIAFLRH